ncbi:MULTISPECIES: 23S rRNA pseudouridine(2604) synthase RluF [Olleya]|uniref:Pseudouridine synthase n=1 Tax=Olleya namhaensis TaxID=1144750 RepID=A0A1I3RM25_9FLAO|nr:MULTISPECIES: 23S rRNA pseudouridine(2604) synthase RluF [Olleya]PKG51206.1 23S rRNA pseudouridine(2604) synthase RluF [Olleya sp. 1-3]SFJ46829.1 23S rRNA pseudouridine2604 synthase [Olleya namhaensis]
MEEKLTRLNKYLSEAGFCSRREGDKLIDAGRVTINGVVPEMGTKVTPSDVVAVDGEIIKANTEKPIYLAFNKPVGIVCTTDTNVEKDNIIDYINYPKRIFPIGRLDKLSDGLIFMTDDGDIVNKILRASNNHDKEYLVTVDKAISQTFINRMASGIYLEDLDRTTKKCSVKKIDSHTFRIILTQGLNRQIRRMCEYLTYEVTSLRRVRIMNIKLDVPVGEYREFTEKELKTLHLLLEDSTKIHEAKTAKENTTRISKASKERQSRETTEHKAEPSRDDLKEEQPIRENRERPIRNRRKED